MPHEHDDRDTLTARLQPSSLPPPPDDGAPSTIETIVAEIRYVRRQLTHVMHAQHTLTDRLNATIPEFDDLGSRVHRIERSLQAVSHVLDQPERHSLILPTNGNGSA